MLDLDATDDPTHGRQQLSAYNAFYGQHQYLPLLVFDGDSGFPLAAVLRPGNAHASWGAVEVLAPLVAQARHAWPEATILVRADCGFAVPALYEFCEHQGLLYAIGLGGNAVLYERTAPALADLETYYAYYGRREPSVQRFDVISDYQAQTWSQPRRVVAKTEINPLGTNRRYVVTDLSGHPAGSYRGVYVKRGHVPEHPIAELKLGLAADRLSSTRVLANSWQLLVHTLAYALVVLLREATAAIPEVAPATVTQLRQKLWKVGALVKTSARRIVFRLSAHWPGQSLLRRVHEQLHHFTTQLPSWHGPPLATAPPAA